MLICLATWRRGLAIFYARQRSLQRADTET